METKRAVIKHRDIGSSIFSISAVGRSLPVNAPVFTSPDRPLLGGSGHWDASSKSHVYDIHERLLSTHRRHSRLRTKVTRAQPRNVRSRLLAALQLLEKLSPRSAAIGQKRSFARLSIAADKATDAVYR